MDLCIIVCCIVLKLCLCGYVTAELKSGLKPTPLTLANIYPYIWYFQGNILASGEEEVSRKLRCASIHNNTIVQKFVDFLWSFSPEWFSSCDRKWPRRALGIHLCNSLPHLCSEGQKGTPIMYLSSCLSQLLIP